MEHWVLMAWSNLLENVFFVYTINKNRIKCPLPNNFAFAEKYHSRLDFLRKIHKTNKCGDRNETRQLWCLLIIVKQFEMLYSIPKHDPTTVFSWLTQSEPMLHVIGSAGCTAVYHTFQLYSGHVMHPTLICLKRLLSSKHHALGHVEGETHWYLPLVERNLHYRIDQDIKLFAFLWNLIVNIFGFSTVSVFIFLESINLSKRLKSDT